MSKKVDLSLLVPDYLYENQRFREFLEVLEEVLTEAIDNVDDLNSLWNMWREGLSEIFEFLDSYFDLVWVEGRQVTESDLMRCIPFAKELIDRKGTVEFLRVWLSAPDLSILLENLFKEIMILSEQGKLSCGFRLQDAKEYRDASLRLTIDSAFVRFGGLENLIKMLPVGMFLLVSVVYWLLQWAKADCKVASASPSWMMPIYEKCSGKGIYSLEGWISFQSMKEGYIDWGVKNYALALVDEYILGGV